MSATPNPLEKYARLSIAAALATIGLKSLAWWLTGSVGLLSDALESTVNLAAAVLAKPLPFRTFLNVNVPLGSVKGVRVTSQAVRNHVTKIDRRLDPRERPYYWIEEAQDDWQTDENSDYQAINDGFASVTPLQPDLTDHSAAGLAKALVEAAAGTGVR